MLSNPMTVLQANPCIVFFCMPEAGHFHRLRSLISGLANKGITVYVLTDVRFKTWIEEAGGRWIDLFSKYPLACADKKSTPVPCRYVSFAGHYAGAILEDVRRLKPSLIIYDTFAVIGYVIATLLEVPYVNVCAGHNVNPSQFMEILKNDPRVNVSEECFNAVKKLRDEYGFREINPFSYISVLSPFLNIYCEPPAFLDEAAREVFKPVAFFGSLPDLEPKVEPSPKPSRYFKTSTRETLKVYISFGTVVWRYYAGEALSVLQSLSDAISEMKHVLAVISLGNRDLNPEAAQGLKKENVDVHNHVEQKTILKEADVFITHHGLNSTHEAIFYRVPMISYPFFWDQPALAQKCQDLGVAIPLVDSLRGRVAKGDVQSALAKVTESGSVIRNNLAVCAKWEEEVMRGRGFVIKKILQCFAAPEHNHRVAQVLR